MSSGRSARHAWPTAGGAARAVLAAAICLGASLLANGRIDDTPSDLDVAWAVLTVAACLPLALRHRVPLVAAVVALSASLVGFALGYSMSAVLVLALALVGLSASRAAVRLTGTLGVYSGAVVAGIALASGDSTPVLATVAGFAVGMLPALLGENLRVERARTHDAREQARRIEELRDRDVQRAVAEERLRVARDVHDITGHHLSAIALQSAGAGRMTHDADARAAFERIHGLTAQALGQTRRTLGVLRDPSEPAALAPPPRLAHVEHLLAPARAAGIDVSLDVEGAPRELSETMEMCAYRVIQESLTNVVRHAGAGRVRVAVAYGEQVLAVVVDDDGQGSDAGRPVRPGSGIEGMRERLALVGGSLAAGPRDGEGWTVHATIPLEDPR
jgi:signal transduction histidine kinase